MSKGDGGVGVGRVFSPSLKFGIVDPIFHVHNNIASSWFLNKVTDYICRSSGLLKASCTQPCDSPTEVTQLLSSLLLHKIEAEFPRITSVDLKCSLFTGLEQYLPRFLELYRAKSANKGLTRLIGLLDDDSSTEMKRAVLLMGLPHFLREDPSHFIKTVEATDAEEEMAKGMKVGIVMVKGGQDVLDASVVLEEQIILHDLEDLPSALSLWLGLLFALNIDYPKELQYTYEVIQKVLMNIGGGQCSSLVHGL